MKNHVLPILISGCLLTTGVSQSSLDASGGYAKSASFSVSYSIGEAITPTLKNSNGSYFVTVGVIQPDPLVITNVEESYLNKQFLYPNPVYNAIYFYPSIIQDVHYSIYRNDGIYINSGKLVNSAIDVQDFLPGHYFIELRDDKTKSYKIYQFVKS
jgi:hypothetical protein